MNVSLIRQQLHAYREALKSVREPTIITVRGGLPDSDDQRGTAHTVNPHNPDRASLSFVQGPSESVEQFRARVLAEAGDVPFIVFGGLEDRGDPPPIYRSEF
jgi:hypothetical protein